jgi:small-conductance mechanosensitive channel
MLAAITISAEWKNWLISAGIFLFFLLLALILRFVLPPIIAVLTHRTKTLLDDLIVKALFPPAFFALIVTGVWIALTRLSELQDYNEQISKATIVIAILLAAVAIARLLNAIIAWYSNEIANRTSTDTDNKLLPVFSRVGNVVIYAIALMFILDKLTINISPLIAGLGVGGLAVAVALQPTLSNFLAGTYVISDSVIRKGHYIMLDSGQEGLVEEIGWRITKIRHWQGNLIVLPNSKLADAVVTDFEAAEPAKVFAVACGVSYDSDLDKVERIALEVAQEIIARCPEAPKDYEPSVRFKEFGDSNINFTVVLKSVDRVSQFPLKHEFIKALHLRFKQEGITIEYPVRKLLLTEARNKTASID